MNRSQLEHVIRAAATKYVRAAFRHGLVREETVLERLGQTALEPDRRRQIEQQVQQDAARARR